MVTNTGRTRDAGAGQGVRGCQPCPQVDHRLWVWEEKAQA